MVHVCKEGGAFLVKEPFSGYNADSIHISAELFTSTVDNLFFLFIL